MIQTAGYLVVGVDAGKCECDINVFGYVVVGDCGGINIPPVANQYALVRYVEYCHVLQYVVRGGKNIRIEKNDRIASANSKPQISRRCYPESPVWLSAITYVE